jgi:hypothetical protein
MKYEDKSTSTKRKHKLTLGPNLSEGFCFIHIIMIIQCLHNCMVVVKLWWISHTFYIRHIFALCEVWSKGTVRGCSDIFITKYNSDPLSYFTKTSVNWQLLFQLVITRTNLQTINHAKRGILIWKSNVRLQLEMNHSNWASCTILV